MTAVATRPTAAAREIAGGITTATGSLMAHDDFETITDGLARTHGGVSMKLTQSPRAYPSDMLKAKPAFR